MKRKILKISATILLIIFIPVVVFYVAIYSWVGFIKLSIIVTGDRIYADKYDKKLAQSIEFALTPDYNAYYSLRKDNSKVVERIEFDYEINNIKYFCMEIGEYSMQTNELFKNMGLNNKYARIIGYKKRLSGGENGSLLLIVKNDNDYIPVTSNFALVDYDSRLKLDENYKRPHCTVVSNLHLKITNEPGKKPHMSLE